MKAFVTGGTSFIGRHVINKLREHNYDVCALVNSKESAQLMEQLGATAVRGTITAIESMRQAMQGSQVVFHMEEWHDPHNGDWQQGEIINVSGTRNVLTLAHELGVPKIIYTSTIAIYGDTQGQLVDETHQAKGVFGSEYERTKWLAHYKVAVPLIEKGAPIMIVIPGTVYGPDDKGIIGDLMHRFYLNQPPLPFLLGPSTTFSYTHVDDVAEGHLLVAEKGAIGESYILAGPAVPLGEMVDFWARLTGKRPPDFHVPASFVRSLAPVFNLLGQFVTLSPAFSQDALTMAGITYMGDGSKARAQLGWQPRSLQKGMLEALGYIAADAAERPMPVSRSREWITIGLVTAVIAVVIWLFFRHQKDK